MEVLIVEVWQTHCRPDLVLVEALSVRLASRNRSVGRILADMHSNRLNWLEHSAPDLIRDVSKGQGDSSDDKA